MRKYVVTPAEEAWLETNWLLLRTTMASAWHGYEPRWYMSRTRYLTVAARTPFRRAEWMPADLWCMCWLDPIWPETMLMLYGRPIGCLYTPMKDLEKPVLQYEP